MGAHSYMGKFSSDIDWLVSESWDRTKLPLPSMKLVINAQDEPRVNFNIRFPNSRELVMTFQDPQPQPFMQNNQRGTHSYFGPAPQGEEHCLVANSKYGFGDLVNDQHACES